MELLTLYAGSEPRLTLADVSAALADGGDSSMQDAVDATLGGDTAAVDRALTLAYDEGVSPVGILRVLLSELARLRVAAGAIAEGASVAEAMAGMRPPVFFKRQKLVTQALSALVRASADRGDPRRPHRGNRLQADAYARSGLLPPDHAGARQPRPQRRPPGVKEAGRFLKKAA